LITSGVRLSALMDIKNMLRYFVFVVCIYTLVGSMAWLIGNTIYDGIVEDYKTRVKTISRVEGLDITLMCNVLNCSNVTHIQNDISKAYVNSNGVLKDTNVFETEERNYFQKHVSINDLTVIEYLEKDIRLVFFINDTEYFELVHNLLMFMFLILAGLLFMFYVVYVGIKYRQDVSETAKLKMQLQGTLQRDLTESLHHEMGMPIALIKSLFRELYAMLYPCSYTVDNVCDFQHIKVDPKHCVDCKQYLNKRAFDSIAIEHYSKIKLATERLDSVLKLISGAKHIKYSNGTVSFFIIMENIIDGVNSYNVSKITPEYENKELLLKYAVGTGLTNGDMLNIFNIMVNNSMEAKASVIKFKAEMYNENKMYIYVTDNGRGIRDSSDRILNDESIFKYGYSTKDENGNQIVAETWIEKLLLVFGFNIINRGVPRGVGLSVNKGILNNVGGDIIIVSTSKSGTTFRLTVPIKERRDVKQS